MLVIVVQSLFQYNEFYVFRPIGNDCYKKIKLHIEKGQIIEDKYNRLNYIETNFITNKIL